MSFNGPINKIDDFKYEIPSSYTNKMMARHNISMKVPGIIYANDKLISAIISDDSPEQVANVATLPGIVGRSIAMPDIHHGYGFAIGGVAAFDADEGVISPGGVGYDINCGVRLLSSQLHYDEVAPKLKKLIDTIFNNIPCGVGSEGRIYLNDKQMKKVLENGSRWAVSEGYGADDDLEMTEEKGSIGGADSTMVSPSAKKRGSKQLGTLGAGNHFIEIQRVETIYDIATARAFGIEDVNQIMIMIHTGSRGCGHQICSDYLEVMRKANKKYNIPLLDRELSCAPASSPESQRYFSAMKCGANFAWANRQLITHWLRQSFDDVYKNKNVANNIKQVYDIAHNMAKLEEHIYEGQKRKVYVHRKGATRSFGPNHPDIPKRYQPFGQPVIIPGDMGSASYLLAGTQKAMEETFGSSCHGAGRALSRTAAKKQLPYEKVISELNDKGIYLQAKSRKIISEEAPQAYKNIDDVIDVTDRAGIARKIVRLVPLGVVKG